MFSKLYDPDAMPAPHRPPKPPPDARPRMLGHPRHGRHLPTGGRMRNIKAQYYGMISEADHQLGRLWAALEIGGQWDNTVIVVTADHGEQLGDHGLIQKLGWFEQSYYIPAIVRDPRAKAAHGRVVRAFTEGVDIVPDPLRGHGHADPGPVRRPRPDAVPARRDARRLA